MTSAEIWPEDLELDPSEPESREDQQSGPVTPWSNRRVHRRPPPGAIAPDHASPLGLSHGPGPGSAGTVDHGRPDIRWANDVGHHGPQGRVGEVAHAAPSEVAAPRPGQASAGPGLAQAEPPRVGPERVGPERVGPERMGPERIGRDLPATGTAGPTVADMLPVMASALDGLNTAKGGAAPVADGSGPMPVAGTGTDALSDIDDGDAGPAGLSPEQARALRALKEMAALYGEGDTTIPEVRELPRQSDDAPGYGDAVTAINTQQALQRNTADTFEDRDHRLNAVLNDFSGRHTAGKSAMNGVLQNVDSALSANPPPYNSAYEKQQVNQIFATALGDGDNIVSVGRQNVDGTVAAINALTKEFEPDKPGKNGNASPETKRPTGKAATKKEKAIKKAIAKAIKAAEKQEGKPYVYGATGPNTWDCSGLTQYALKKAGVNIKRTTWAQRDQLRKVTGIPKAGDLVFSSSGGHVLLCIGNNQFIHAPKTGDVVRKISLKTLTNNYPSYQVRRWTHLVPVNG